MKIVILGPSGTGKTTLCSRLGKKYNIQTLHLDSVYWLKDWERITKSDFHNYIVSFLKKHNSWIIDGNYTNNRHFKFRLDMADIIIFLDFGKQKSLQGIHQRAEMFKRQVRPDMAEGCYEGIDQVFLEYVANFNKFRAKYLKAIITKYKNRKQVLIFKNRENLYKWFNTL